MQSLVHPAASIDDALNVYRTSTAGWETADEYFQSSNSHLPSLHKVVDPGIQLHSIQPLPHAFVTQYNNVQYKSFMGLFPQINRAWLTVDSKLFLWAYNPFGATQAVNDFYVYEGLSQIIVSVALVPPRPGVFVDSVKYLLAVATTVEVTLLGITFSPTGELNLVPTQISVATDNTIMLKLLATPSGRIFMAGADGALHEFEYEARPHSSLLDLISGRPAKHARKIAHNATSFAKYILPSAVKSFFARSDEIVDLAVDTDVLYTLSQEGVLSVYDASVGARCVATVNVKQDVKSMTFSMPAADREFVSIHAVPVRVSQAVQLIVVTSFGERIYYSTRSPSMRVNGSISSRALRPRTLRFTAFRPSPDRNARLSRPCVHIAWCERGAAVFADLKENESDRLFAVYPDASLVHSPSGMDYQPGTVKTAEVVFETSLGEGDSNYQTSMSLTTPMTRTATRTNGYGTNGSTSYGPKRTFAIVEAGNGQTEVDDETPIEAPSYFWVLTSNAMHLYERVQPINRLREILSSGGGSPSEIKDLFARYGPAEACSLCLEIAVSNPQLSHAAAKVFYTFGGEPAQERREASQAERVRPSSDAGGRRFSFFGTASANGDGHARPSSFDVGRPSLHSGPLTRFSGAHDGTAWYLARVLHPVWTKHITSERDPEAYQRLSSSKELLGRVRDQLLAVVSFLQKYTPDAMLPEATGDEENRSSMANGHDLRRGGESRRNSLQNGAGLHSQDRREDGQERMFRGLYQLKRTGQARQAEANSIMSLKGLAVRTIEALALLLILTDHQLHRLVVSMPKDSRELLAKMRLCDLVVGEEGNVVSAALIEAIFSSYRDGTAAVTNVGRMLQERCSSYFGDSDVDLHRGLAVLRQAVETVAGVSGGANGNLMTDRGYDAQVGMLGSSHGSVSVWDTALNLAEEAGQIIKTVPARVFDIVAVCEDFKAVRAIPSLVDVALTIGKVAEATGNEERSKTAYECIFEALRPFFNGHAALAGSPEVIEANGRLKDASMRVALGAESETFLRGMYEFLLGSEQGREELLKQTSPNLESFLEEKGALDLLWRYCARHGRHLEAAGVLQKLAETEEAVSLVDRLNYLSCALHNAKTASSNGDGRAVNMLTEISDFMEVAKVQLRVQEELKRRQAPSEVVEEALRELDGEVLELSTLFNKYARPFKLYESSLEIFRCGSYRDEAYIRGLWTEILQQEAEESVTPALIRQKMLALGREFYPSDVVFPTSYIIDLLERLVYSNSDVAGWSDLHDWVSKTMQAIGVPLAGVVEGYRLMLESPPVGEGWSWSEENAQLHLLRATERVIDIWYRQIVRSERSVLSEADKALRAITLCKSRLRGMSCAGVDTLAQRFEELERKINPLVQTSGF